MKALNRKERNSAFLKVAIFFLPMLGVVVMGMALHGTVNRKHLGDLEQKKKQYRYSLKAQSEKALKMEEILNDITELRADSQANYLVHQRKQKNINVKLGELKKISLTLQDSSYSSIQPIPAIYDSLVKSVQFIQATQDSLKTCDVKNANLKFQLQECLDALQERINEEGETGGGTP